MWHINDDWICASPDRFFCPEPRKLKPLCPLSNASADLRSLGNGIYSKKEMQNYRIFMASGYGAKQLISGMSESYMPNGSGSFDITPLLYSAMGALSDIVSKHIFGIFAKLDTYMYPAITIFAFWSLLWVCVRNTMTTFSILRVEGFKIWKIMIVWIDPIFYIVTLPMMIQWSIPKETQTEENPKPTVPKCGIWCESHKWIETNCVKKQIN